MWVFPEGPGFHMEEQNGEERDEWTRASAVGGGPRLPFWVLLKPHITKKLFKN